MQRRTFSCRHLKRLVGLVGVVPYILALLAVGFASLPAAAVEIDSILIGNPRNRADANGIGSVPYVYSIARFEVTNDQYAEFLNAVADSDPNGLYDESMAGSFGGITRGGAPGSHTYTVKTGHADRPVVFVSFWSAIRFANWLQNGQPTAPQGIWTTEDGAYTITPGGIDANSITRNQGALFAVPSEAEWYKAAYYDRVLGGYFEYPTGTDVQTTCELPMGGTNSANCGMVVNELTDVGAYTFALSPNGTFDQGGNVSEWTEESTGLGRIVRGGSWFDFNTTFLAASNSSGRIAADNGLSVGFRVIVPEPGLIGGVVAVLALASLRRGASANRRRVDC